MSRSHLSHQIAERAGRRCEYCKTPQVVTAQPFHLDHIIPRSLGGKATLDNLCYACPRCNYLKGAQTKEIDPQTGKQIPLFNPKSHQWEEHFVWEDDGVTVVGNTAIGRTTVAALKLNAEIMLRARVLWLKLGLLP